MEQLLSICIDYTFTTLHAMIHMPEVCENKVLIQQEV